MSGHGGSDPVRVRALALHAGYRCHATGACCRSDWEIPVEPDTEDVLRAALRGGALRLSPAGSGASASVAPARAPLGENDVLPRTFGPPGGKRAFLGRDADGRCLFLETAGGNRCAIHRQLGEEALPSACRQFPRLARLTPHGVEVSLSHYCPTAVGALFGDFATGVAADPLLRIVESPPAFPRSWPYLGLDARDAFPPLLRPGVLTSWGGHERWEAHAVAVLAAVPAPERAIAILAADAERARVWKDADGDFDTFLDGVLAESEGQSFGDGEAFEESEASPERARRSLARWQETLAAVPAPVRALARPQRMSGSLERASSLVAAGCPLFRLPIRRWLAARTFASWLALQGDGLRTSVCGLRLALDVLWAEALAGCAESRRPLDAALLREALRGADLLLVHLADPEALARGLSRSEGGE